MSITLSKLRTNGVRNEDEPSSFKGPEVCGYFSINGDGRYLADTSQLKYLSKPSSDFFNFDLKKGYGSVIRKPVDPCDGKIDNLLRWILENSDKIKASSGSDRWLDADFVCFRGRLLKLFATPFEKQNGWIISACKWRGTIYLCEFQTEKKKLAKKRWGNKMLEILSWGFKFEQYMLSDAPNEEPDTSKPVNESEEFCCIFKSRLGNHRLLYSSEIDGVSSDEVLKEPIDLNDVKLVELKSSKMLEFNKQKDNFAKDKLFKWWSQCSLVGIDEVLCGFRTDNGIVKKLENFKVAEMPEKSKKFWNPNQCLNFCDDFLNVVKSTVQKDYDQCVYKFVWEPGQSVKVEEVDPRSEYAILPDWFINEDKEQMSNNDDSRQEFVVKPTNNYERKDNYNSKQHYKGKNRFSRHPYKRHSSKSTNRPRQ